MECLSLSARVALHGKESAHGDVRALWRLNFTCLRLSMTIVPMDSSFTPRRTDCDVERHDHRKVLTALDDEKVQMSEDSQGEEVEEGDHVDEDFNGSSIIGISIGQKQDRLRAPETPAVEKEEALAGQDPFDAALRDYGAARRFGPAHLDDQRYRQVGPIVQPDQGHAANEHLSRDGVKDIPNLDGVPRSKFRDESERPRAATGLSPSTSGSQGKKLVSFGLPSLPSFPKSNRFSLPSIDGALAWVRSVGNDDSKVVKGHDRHGHASNVPKSGNLAQRFGSDRRSSFDNLREPPVGPGDMKSKPPQRLLRRSTSDNSLTLMRSASRASSLGDDSRFEDISEQVNSRMKAIKDSWQDTNLKFPSFEVYVI